MCQPKSYGGTRRGTNLKLCCGQEAQSTLYIGVHRSTRTINWKQNKHRQLNVIAYVILVVVPLLITKGLFIHLYEAARLPEWLA